MENLSKIKQIAKYGCDKCGFLYAKPKIKRIHDGITTREYEVCPRCQSEDIHKLEDKYENKDKR